MDNKQAIEAIAIELFFHDWDEENNYATANASNGVWEEQVNEQFRNHYFRRAQAILSLPEVAQYFKGE